MIFNDNCPSCNYIIGKGITIVKRLIGSYSCLLTLNDPYRSMATSNRCASSSSASGKREDEVGEGTSKSKKRREQRNGRQVSFSSLVKIRQMSLILGSTNEKVGRNAKRRLKNGKKTN